MTCCYSEKYLVFKTPPFSLCWRNKLNTSEITTGYMDVKLITSNVLLKSNGTLDISQDKLLLKISFRDCKYKYNNILN